MFTVSAATMFGRSKRLCQSHDADRKALRVYYKSLGTPLGIPTMKGATADAGMEMK